MKMFDNALNPFYTALRWSTQEGELVDRDTHAYTQNALEFCWKRRNAIPFTRAWIRNDIQHSERRNPVSTTWTARSCRTNFWFQKSEHYNIKCCNVPENGTVPLFGTWSKKIRQYYWWENLRKKQCFLDFFCQTSMFQFLEPTMLVPDSGTGTQKGGLRGCVGGRVVGKMLNGFWGRTWKNLFFYLRVLMKFE